MKETDEKQPLFIQSNSFWDTIGYLEAYIAKYWSNGMLAEAYEKMRHYWRITSTHYKKKDSNEELRLLFDEVHKLLYDSKAEGFDRNASFRKMQNLKAANSKMEETYMKLKENIANSNLELVYGVPKSVQIDKKRLENIRKVFGKTQYEEE